MKSAGCYAADLDDCDGRALTREHFISKNLLEQFGPTFVVAGTSWAGVGRRVSAKSFTSKILCKHHNNALAELDTAFGNFHRIIVDARNKRTTAPTWFRGEDVERWGLKLLLGAIASGNMSAGSHHDTLPDDALRILFTRTSMPETCGFSYIGDKVDGFDSDLMDVAINRFPAGHPLDGTIFGISIRVPGFQFVVSLAPNFQTDKQRLIFRPDGFILGAPERARIGFQWGGAQGSTQVLLLKM